MIFNYTPILQDHLTLSAFFVLASSFICFYFIQNRYFRLGIFSLALFLGVVAGRLDWIGVVLIILFGGLFYSSIHANKPLVRKLAFLVTLLCSIAIMLIDMPGIFNWQAVYRLYITDDAIPYSMAFTFDKSLIGLFFIWFSSYSLANEGKWKPVLKTGFLAGCAAAVVLLPLSLGLGYVAFDFKLTSLFFLWAIHNLLFVSIAEEALFRGMIQRFLMTQLQHFAWGKWVALIITAALFGAAHFKGGMNYMLLAGVAGLFYGYAFIKAKKIEASILTHFMVNTIHFIFFTYPALQSAFI